MRAKTRISIRSATTRASARRLNPRQRDEAITPGAHKADQGRQGDVLDRAVITRGAEVHQHDLTENEVGHSPPHGPGHALLREAHPAPGVDSPAHGRVAEAVHELQRPAVT